MAGIYIHIPFCKQKCIYCNFFSLASNKYRQVFTETLLKEIRIQKDYLGNETIETIYFGGGTPSLLDTNEISLILNELSKHHNIDKAAEITLEANPDDLTKAKVAELKKTNINRLSIGIQSFSDTDLRYLRRMHNSRQAYVAVKLAQDTGFQNITADLIYGIPSLSNAGWEQNLIAAFELQVPHISAYSLTVEQKTILSNFIQTRRLPPVDESLSIKHYETLLKLMGENNYIHYEISNFCRKGFISKHNSNYWEQKKYLGLGPSAHSYDGNSRQWNISNLTQYIDSVKNKNVVPYVKEILSEQQKYNEYVMTSLRTMWGCDMKYIEDTFGKEMLNYFLSQLPDVHKQFLKENNRIIYLSDKGKLFADKIASEFFIV